MEDFIVLEHFVYVTLSASFEPIVHISSKKITA